MRSRRSKAPNSPWTRTSRTSTARKELFEQKLISREVFDNLASEFAIAENAYVKAQRKLQLVDDKLRKTKVTAPSDGTVLTVPVIEGQVVIAAASVNSGTTLMTIANLSKLLVETHINQVDVARLELNQDVKLRAESLKDADLEAKISFIAPVATVKNNVKGFQVQALIDKPEPAPAPRHDRQHVHPDRHADDAISVPISAVFRGEGQQESDLRAQRRGNGAARGEDRRDQHRLRADHQRRRRKARRVLLVEPRPHAGEEIVSQRVSSSPG